MSRLSGALSLVCGLFVVIQGGAADPPAKIDPEAPKAVEPARTDVHGDPLPASVRARMGTIRLRHGGAVLFVGFTDGGKQLLSASTDGFLRAWAPANGKELRHVQLASDDSNGRSGMSSMSDGNVRLIQRYEARGSARLVLSADGKTLAVHSDVFNNVDILEAATGKRLHQFRTAGTFANTLALTPDGKAAATRGYDGVVRLWDVAAGKEVRQLGKAEDGRRRVFFGRDGNSLCFSPDGKTVASFSVERGDKGFTSKVELWERETGKLLRKLAPPANVYGASLAFAPNGKQLAFSGWDGTCRLYEVDSGKELRLLGKRQENRGICCLVFSPDGKTLALKPTQTAQVTLVEVATGKELRQLGEKFDPDGANQFFYNNREGSQDIAFAPDGKMLAVGTPNGAVRLWDIESGKEMLPGHGHQGAVVALFVTADGKTLTTLGEDQTLRQWEMATGKELRTVRLPAGAGKPVLSPDGKMAAFGTPNNKFHLWDVTTGKERATPKLADVQFGQLVGGAGGVAFAADNKSVAVNDLDGWVRTFDTATGKESHKCSTRIGNQANLVFVNGATPGIALASDGVTVATVGSEPDNDNGFHDRSLSLIRLWNLTTGRHVRQCEARQLDVLALAFAPGGWTLAAAHADQTVSLWETATGKERCRLTCRGGLMAAVQDRFGQRSSGANVECLAFSRDGRFLAGGCSDRKIYLWNARTGRKLGEFAVHHGEIRSLTFTPDGQTLVGGSTDTTALTIDVAPLLPNADPPTDLEPQKLEAYWKDLSADAAGRGYQAVVALSRSPKQLLPLVRERVRPAAGIEQRQLNQLLADLDSKHFLVRQRATDELEKLGDLAEVPVKRALEGKPPLEVRHRLEQIMERLLTGQSPPPELLQALRAVETLELIGTPEAAQSLELLSRGVAGARLTREARAAADRLTRSK